MRRRSSGRCRPVPASATTSPSSTMRPRSGRSSPASSASRVDLPAPEAPNSAVVAAAGAAKAASTRNAPRASPASKSITGARSSAARAAPASRRAAARRGRSTATAREPQRRRFAARGLQRAVDREWQRLRFAGHAGGEGDHGPELAEAGREADDRGRDHARHRQRQRDREEAVEPAGAERTRRELEAGIDRLDRQPHRAHHDRECHHARRQRGAGRGEHQPRAERRFEPAADRALDAEGQQQHVADHHRRQHQRRVHDGVQHRLAGETRASQQPGRRHRERQPDRHRARAHHEARDECRPFDVGKHAARWSAGRDGAARRGVSRRRCRTAGRCRTWPPSPARPRRSRAAHR